ncbi:MAG: 2-amino-4-hydroxy-6-hydroxymethyldihydropteridine diphosphokinase [Pseudomonadota bacterium]
MSDTQPALIALGANLGDRRATFCAALDALSATNGIEVTAHSALYETAPVGGPSGQGAFFNAAAALSTTLQPLALLDRLQEIETHHKRARDVHWGPRTLDLDLLFYGTETIDNARLTIPHPRLVERRFVLAPLADIAGDYCHPALGVDIATLLNRLPQRDIDDVAAIDTNWWHP